MPVDAKIEEHSACNTQAQRVYTQQPVACDVWGLHSGLLSWKDRNSCSQAGKSPAVSYVPTLVLTRSM